MQKRFIIIFIIFIMSLTLLGGCTNKNKQSGRIKIVTTIFSEYDWVLNVLGDQKDQKEVTLLLDKGIDLHSYQPSVVDIAKVSSCDLFIYVGGESDDWVDKTLANATNKEMVVINLLEVLGDRAKEEELVDGMEAPDEEEDEEEEVEYDEHVWLSLQNASLFVDQIALALGQIDEENKDIYLANANQYKTLLQELDNRYRAAVNSANKNVLLFGDRFPFRYLVDDYNLSYYAAFIGCSAETEASFETIIFLANKVNEYGLSSIIKIESSDGKIAKTIKENTNTKDQKILTLDSLQSATMKEYQAGRTYLKVMEDNLSVLIEALN